jgi:hypothetical protein
MAQILSVTALIGPDVGGFQNYICESHIGVSDLSKITGPRAAGHVYLYRPGNSLNLQSRAQGAPRQ